MGRFADLLGTLADAFSIGPKGARAKFDASGVTAERTITLPDASGTLKLTGHFDGGNAASVYTAAQHTFDGGGA